MQIFIKHVSLHLGAIFFLQEVTLVHPKRNIKNHAVMFWNATFARSQALNYPEKLRYACVSRNTIAIRSSFCADLDSITVHAFMNFIFNYYFFLQASSSGRQR